MRTKTRAIWLTVVLLTFSIAMSGCNTQEPAEALFTPTATPGIVHMGTPVEIPLDEPLSCLHGRSVEGDALFGIVRLNDKVRATVVNLAAGQAHLADVGRVSLPPDSMRYVAYVQTGAPYTEPDTLLLYDLLEGTTLEVAKGELNSYYLDISGDIVVWAETRGSGRNIYGYNLSQNQRFTITEGHSSRTSPQTSGDWVVYVFWHHEEQPTHILRAC